MKGDIGMGDTSSLKGLKLYGLKTDGLVSIDVLDTYSTAFRVGTVGDCLSLPKDENQIKHYRADAREVIDKLSSSMNAMGLNYFAAALLYELLVEGYKGVNNT